MLQKLFLLCIRLLKGVTATQWKRAVELVTQYEKSDLGNETKRSQVAAALRDQWPKLLLHVVNWLVESALLNIRNK